MITALCRLAEPIALTSIFPYAFPLVKRFRVCDEANASVYAGFFISAFALSESLTGLFWGGLSDRVGRKPILLFGCAGTILSLLIVGLASNFWVALSGRAIGGLLNGNHGVIQTMVGELVKRPEHERKSSCCLQCDSVATESCSESICGYAICMEHWNNHWAGYRWYLGGSCKLISMALFSFRYLWYIPLPVAQPHLRRAIIV